MEISRHRVQPTLKPLPNIKNIIAIASGKGGVGKSTISVNLALSLSQLGFNIGLLDADIYGPSAPQMMGMYDPPAMTEDKKIKPIERHGISFMSVGNLVNQDNAIIWRGPMVSTALKQLLNDTQWPELDILIVDLPPGTGDIQLTMSQKIPVAASVIVTTPQDLSLIDARRAVAMFNKVNIPVLGVVENMSQFICPHCHQSSAIFGEGAGKHIAEQYDLELLAQLPLAMRLREEADSGTPTVAADVACNESEQFISLAENVLTKLATLPKDYSLNMPNIRVEKS